MQIFFFAPMFLLVHSYNASGAVWMREGACQGQRGEPSPWWTTRWNAARVLQLRLQERVPTRLHSCQGRLCRRAAVSTAVRRLQQSQGSCSSPSSWLRHVLSILTGAGSVLIFQLRFSSVQFSISSTRFRFFSGFGIRTSQQYKSILVSENTRSRYTSTETPSHSAWSDQQSQMGAGPSRRCDLLST